MAIFSDSPRNPSSFTHDKTSPRNTAHSTMSKSSTDSAATKVNSIDNTAEFVGDIDTNNALPTPKTLRKIDSYQLLDAEGKTHTFKSLYSGPGITKRVLVVFIRHFFCGVNISIAKNPRNIADFHIQNCQEYIRTLHSSLPSPEQLLYLPIPTSIIVVGCGDPSLIPMYISETSCPYPIFADPSKKLYDTLGMQKTLNLGERPEYQRRKLFTLMTASFIQSLKMIKSGLLLKGGGYQQVGGEFVFQPKDLGSPNVTPGMDGGKQLEEPEKIVTWCHRMRNTRDHAEMPELREVLGIDEAEPVKRGRSEKRWSRAMMVRKGTGLSVDSSAMNRSNKMLDAEMPARMSEAFVR